ncbi:MAG: hypothetical protein Q7R39_02130 [Dehalococcoidia bacterium]|nr:hypothetical protein [Dehalococcoidia bacterium]
MGLPTAWSRIGWWLLTVPLLGLAMNIAANLLMPWVQQQGGLVQEFLGSVWAQLIVFVILLGIWGWFSLQLRRPVRDTLNSVKTEKPPSSQPTFTQDDPEPGITEEQSSVLAWAYNLRREDRERLRGFLHIETHVQLGTIYSTALPYVGLEFTILSSAVCRVRIGREVEGTVRSVFDGEVGRTPEKLPDTSGRGTTLVLDRGVRAMFPLRQIITSELRDRWLKNRLGEEIKFDLTQLYISVDILDSESTTGLFTERLYIPSEVSARLERSIDWDWSRYSSNDSGL